MPARPLVIAARWDQLGGRLSAIVNALCLAERLGFDAGFVWPRWVSVDMRTPEQLFKPDYIARMELDPQTIEGRPRLPAWELEDLGEAELRAAVAAAPAGTLIDVNEWLAIVPWAESADDAHARFLRCFAAMGWNETARGLLNARPTWAQRHVRTAVHVRAGDIVDGDWRHVVSHLKYAPTPFVIDAIQRFGDGRRGSVIVTSDNAGLQQWLVDHLPEAVPAAVLVDGYAELSRLQRALADILVLSTCESIVGTPSSAFSALAANLGDGRVLAADATVPAGTELAVLRDGLAAARPEALWAPLRARDACWCVDVFADVLSPDNRRALIDLALELEPEFAGALARSARLAALSGDDATAMTHAAEALRIADAQDAYGDAIMEAVSTAAAVGCLAIAHLHLSAPAYAEVAALRDRAHATTTHMMDAASTQASLRAMLDVVADLDCASLDRRNVVARALDVPGTTAAPDAPSRLQRHRDAPLFDPVALDVALLRRRLEAAVAAGSEVVAV